MKTMNQYTPANLHRVPYTKRVKLSQLKYDEFVTDPLFSDYYLNFIQGKEKAVLTRINDDRIIPGFYKKNKFGKTDYIQDSIDSKHVVTLQNNIRAGHRPTIYIYPSPDIKDKFQAPDDQGLMAAYRGLGFKSIPVTILHAKSSCIDESAIIISGLHTPIGDYKLYSHAECKVASHVESINGIKVKDNDLSFKKLIDYVNDLMNKLKLFHRPVKKHQLHYHHTLYSTLARVKSTLQAIEVLMNKGYYYQSLVLVRTLYEIALSFYVDWLCPEYNGPMLQAASCLNRTDWGKIRSSCYDKASKNGLQNTDVKRWMDADKKHFDLAAKVSEKALLNPLSAIHKNMYNHLSHIVHQDFIMSARFTHELEHDKQNNFKGSDIKKTIRIINVIVTQVLLRIEADGFCAVGVK